MRMKKFLILSAAVLGAVACSNTYEVKTAPEKAIGFGTWTETLTKARATGNTGFENDEAFDVYGFKGTNSVVFNGDDVKATVTGSTVSWDYENHRFWDPSVSSYTFFAVLPANQLAAEASANLYATTGQFASNDITFGDPTALSNDVLVADKTVVNGTGAAVPYTYTNPVNINFNHIASCVDLKVKQDNALGNAVVQITALSLVNIKNNGKFSVSGYDDAPSNAPSISWGAPSATATTLGTGGVYTVSGTYPVTVAGKTTYNETTHAGTTDGTPSDLFSGYVFMPQDLDGTQKIRLSYTIQVGSETANAYNDVEIDLASFLTPNDTDNSAGTAITSWDAGTHYTYYITIGANSIVFTASVNEWASTVNGYRYLIN